MIGLQEKPNFSRVVSRIAATENASFSKKGAWMDLVPDEYRLLLGMLDENILSDLVELRLSKNPESLRMHLRKHIEAKAQDYYRLRSKEVEPFEYDQHDDANDVGFGFGCNNSNGTSVTTPDWGSDVHSDPRTDNVDDDPPNLAVPTTATLEESKVSGRVCIHVYHPYTHKSISSIPESLDAEKIFYKVTPTAGSTFEGTKIEDHLITDTVDVTTRNKKKKKKKKQKAGARRKSKHTGKKHAERNSGTAAAAETAMGHSSSPKNPTDKEKLTIEAKDMVTTSDVYYNAATYFPDERNLLAPIVPQVAQTMMISPPQRYSSTGSLHITQSPVLQDIINSVETTAMENPQSSTSLQGPGVLHIDENEQMASEPPSNPSHSFVNMRQDSNQFFSSEAKHLIDTPGVERQKFDEDFVLESVGTGLYSHDNRYQYLHPGERIAGALIPFMQWDSSYPNVVCHTHSICSWQPACRFHHPKLGCGCWICPLPQRSCCCAHSPVNCFYHDLLTKENLQFYLGDSTGMSAMESSTTEKDIGNLQTKTPPSILPRSSQSPAVTSFVPNSRDFFNPVGPKFHEMSRKSRSSSRSSSRGSKPTLGGPSISSTMAKGPSSAETPDMFLRRQTGTGMQIPSSKLSATHSDGNLIYQDNSVKSYTKRKSYAQITRLGLAAPKASAHMDPPIIPPREYFDAKKIVESSPATSLPRHEHDIVLVEHLRNQFGQPAYSDLQILVGTQDCRHLQEVYQNGDWEVFYTHMAVLDASPFMRQVLEARCYRNDDGLNYIHAIVGSSFNHIQAFSMALHYLYSMPLVKDENLRNIVLASTPDIPSYVSSVQPYLPERSMACFALCYASSGLFLDIPKIVERGMELAIGLLEWSTVEVLLHFGMRTSSFLITCPEVHNGSIADEALRGHDPQHSWPRKVSLAHINEFEDRWATATLNVALEFIANGITADFVVYDRAQAEIVSPRISHPLWTLPHSQCSDPTLERFRFGGMPSFADTAPTSKAVLVASAMLLTLPFEVLTKLLDILKQRGVARVGLIMEVVRLREERRVRAVHRYHSHVWPPGHLRESDLEVLAYREMVTIDDRRLGPDVTILELSLLRQWVGLKLPQMEALKRTRKRKDIRRGGKRWERELRDKLY